MELKEERQNGRHCQRNAEAAPLVVDVDGTLLRGDLLIEGMARLVAASAFYLFALPLWLAGGRARLKRRVAEAAPLPPDSPVLDPAVRDEITAALADGREVYLASAADAHVVAPLADAIGASGYFASDGRVNLAGRAKADALVARFGEAGFDYIGNSRRDLAVWERARHAVGVNLSAGVARRLRALDANARILSSSGKSSDYLRALRPHQWVKNLLVFAPLVAAHETQVGPYLVVAGVFAALSLGASGTYVFNDLLDIAHDRKHRRKRARPVAAGKVPLPAITGIGAMLIGGGIAAVFAISTAAGLWMLLYLGMSLAYSLWIKKWVFADVAVLAVLYTMRILIGAAAVSITPSLWFLEFSIFIFLALAAAKRQAELFQLQRDNAVSSANTPGRSYYSEDRIALAALSAAAGCASVVILMLYVHSSEEVARYSNPRWLWLVCPLLLYWLGRLSLLAHRGAVDDDPVVFALRDRATQISALALITVFFAAL